MKKIGIVVTALFLLCGAVSVSAASDMGVRVTGNTRYGSRKGAVYMEALCDTAPKSASVSLVTKGGETLEKAPAEIRGRRVCCSFQTALPSRVEGSNLYLTLRVKDGRGRTVVRRTPFHVMKVTGKRSGNRVQVTLRNVPSGNGILMVGDPGNPFVKDKVAVSVRNRDKTSVTAYLSDRVGKCGTLEAVYVPTKGGDGAGAQACFCAASCRSKVN